MLNKYTTALNLLLLLLISTEPAFGQNTNSNTEPAAERWFQVELILFSRTDAYQNLSSAESWPNDITLQYSNNWLQLKDAEKGTKKEESPTGKKTQIPFTQTSSIQVSPTQADVLVKLPNEKMQLNAQAQAIEQNSAYQLLFHEAWMQPMLEGEFAPSILIAAGEQFGKHQILEGEIKLSVSRYLHFSSNLWLSQFEMNYGQTQQQIWPEIPAPPNTLNPNIFSDKSNDLTDQSSGFSTDSITDNLNDHSANSPQFNLYNQEQTNQSLYIPSRIAKITSKRRMRSKEIHYIDHPLFGIIIKILPIESKKP